jgi:uncharacterized membrane protein YcaP (DUF421 family)
LFSRYAGDGPPRHKRSLSRKTAFDAVLIVILASVLSRAINGSAPFLATLGGGIDSCPSHRLLALVAYYSHWFGTLIKGRPEVIWEDGNFILRTMRRNHISTHDVEEDLRLAVKTEELDNIRVGYVERSGDISFIKKRPAVTRLHLAIDRERAEPVEGRLNVERLLRDSPR